MKRVSIAVVVLLVLGASVIGVMLAISAYNGLPAAKKGRKLAVTISNETTFFTAPIRSDGSVDYAAALNGKYGVGVTPDNNACVYLVRAFGPMDTVPSFYAELQMKAPPASGAYLQSLRDFIVAKGYARKVVEKIDIDQSVTLRRPWSGGEFPELSEWIDKNQAPLKLVGMAAQCNQFHSPLTFNLVNGKEPETPPLFTAAYPCGWKLRTTASLLCSRGLRHAGENNLDAAWQDLMTCRRLGRLCGAATTRMDALVGYAMERQSTQGMLGLLEATRPSAESLHQFRNDLEGLPPLRKTSEIVDVAERVSFLDLMLAIARDPTNTEFVIGLSPKQLSDFVQITNSRSFNWDETLLIGNEYYDRLVGCLNSATFEQRQRALKTLEAELSDLNFSDVTALRDSEDEHLAACLVVSLLIDSAIQMRRGEDSLRQAAINIDVALALAQFRNENGSFPEDLSQLMPDHLPALPKDLYTNQTLGYQKTEVGYRLFSVGPNLRDDGHRNDDSRDDIEVRMDGKFDERG